MKFMDELNDAQRQAVTAPDGPLLIVAGPGTGKTKTLTARIAYLLTSRHVPASSVLALTFTNKSAQEMQERVRALLGDAPTPLITTFHAYGHRLLQKQDTYELIDEAARTQLIRDLPKPAVFKGTSMRELGLLISRAKTTLHEPTEPATQKLCTSYNQALQQAGQRDFDDLLRQTYDLLQQPDAPTFAHVLVDEFQDTSPLQYELLRSLCPQGNIFAIGDPNQSIYAFRGAGAGMFGQFRADLPYTRTITLTINYRSAPQIVRLANAIFPDDAPLAPHQQMAGTARAIQTLNEYTEASYILEDIEAGIGGSDMLKVNAGTGRQLRDYAVLYRTHRAAMAVQKRCAESGIPYQIAGEDSPYEQPSVQALITLFRYLLTHSEADHHALLKQHALRHWTLAQCDAALATLPPLASLGVSDLATKLGELFHLDDATVRQFTSMLVQFGMGEPGLAAALQHIASIAEQEFYDPSVNAVTLLTIHASKGLEFDHVFLCASEDGTIPKLRKNGSNDLDEERRLFYVAATRARQQLDILYAKHRGGALATPSRFITELTDDALPRITDPNMAVHQKRAEKRRQKRAQTSLF